MKKILHFTYLPQLKQKKRQNKLHLLHPSPTRTFDYLLFRPSSRNVASNISSNRINLSSISLLQVAGTYGKSSSSSIPIHRPSNYIDHHQTSRPLAVQSHYSNEPNHHQWAKPSPPIPSTCINNSPRNSATGNANNNNINNNNIHGIGSSAHRPPSSASNNNRKSDTLSYAPAIYHQPCHQQVATSNNCLYLVSPRRQPNSTASSGRSSPLGRAQPRLRVRTNPWLATQNQYNPGAGRNYVHRENNGNFPAYGGHHNNQDRRRNPADSSRFERCCRQESRSVGQSP